MGDEEDVLKPHRMAIDDDFMMHPGSGIGNKGGAFIRNPLKEKAKSQPILLSASEFSHNCLDDALGEWHCVSVSESSFRDMMSHYAETHGSGLPSKWSRTAKDQSRCTIGRVHSLSNGFDFVAQLRKSTYVAPRKKPAGRDRKDTPGVMIDKLNMEVVDVDGQSLRVENMTEGLVLVWNRTHPSFQVKKDDIITRVNDKGRSSAAMIEELQQAPDLVRMTVHRTPERRGSKDHPDTMMSLATEGTMLPGGMGNGELGAGSLAKPNQSAPRKSSK